MYNIYTEVNAQIKFLVMWIIILIVINRITPNLSYNFMSRDKCYIHNSTS